MDRFLLYTVLYAEDNLLNDVPMVAVWFIIAEAKFTPPFVLYIPRDFHNTIVVLLSGSFPSENSYMSSTRSVVLQAPLTLPTLRHQRKEHQKARIGLWHHPHQPTHAKRILAWLSSLVRLEQ
jgi:hypothetical protein